jgi:hypothetical protein
MCNTKTPQRDVPALALFAIGKSQPASWMILLWFGPYVYSFVEFAGLYEVDFVNVIESSVRRVQVEGLAIWKIAVK